MAAARRVERQKPMPKLQAQKAEQALRRIFGRNLLAARERAELSQQALGDLADISPNYIGRAERASANVSLDVVARLAACLSISPAELLIDNH